MEPQNGWVWQGHLCMYGPTPAKAGTHRAGRSGSFWSPPRQTPTDSGQPIPVLHHLHSIKVLPEIQSDPHVLHFADAVPCLLSGNTKKNLAPFSLHLPFRYLYRLIKSLLSCFFSRLNSPSSPSFFSEERCSKPFVSSITLHWTLYPVCFCHSDTAEPRTAQ